MSWDNFLKRSIVTSFATVILTLSSSAQLPNLVLYATNSDGTIVGFDSAGNRTLVAGLSQNLQGLAFDSSGNLYVAGANNIFKIDPSGAGSIFASVSNPKGVASDGTANLFVATSDGVIQKITFAGVISTFFADSNRSFAGLALDSGGNLFAADDANRTVVEYDSNANAI